MRDAQRYRRLPIHDWKLATCGALPLHHTLCRPQAFYVVAGWNGFFRKRPADGKLTPDSVWPTNLVTDWQFRGWPEHSGRVVRPYTSTPTYIQWWGFADDV